ncbi:MAG: type III-B CRISPR module RAMP protein Cmr4 [Bacteroidia bacterium]
MQFKTYIIRNTTPMHAGSGDTNFGIVDKRVQRDELNNLPTVHASSLKGALREYFEFCFGKNTEIVNSIFGKEGNDNTQGCFYFHAAYLISAPVRSNKMPFFRATSFGIVKEFVEQLKLRGNATLLFDELLKLDKEKAWAFDEKYRGAILEEHEWQISDIKPLSNLNKLEEVFGENFILLPDNQLIELAKSLPVLARNQLDNGVSKNLWYEEIVPRETRFYTFLGAKPQDWVAQEKNIAKLTERLVQLGGNATIGYGQCSFNQF